MKGKTNSQISGGLKNERLNISLKTNQSSHDDLIGAIIMVTCGENTVEYIWEGKEIIVEILPGVNYLVEYSPIDGYATPDIFSSTAIEGNARTLIAEYKTEFLTVEVSADEGSISGYEITISKQEILGETVKYTRLEYIESNGNQWINTGYIISGNNARIVYDYEFVSLIDSVALFGSQTTTGAPYMVAYYSGGKLKFYCGSSSGLIPIEIDAEYRFSLDMRMNNGTLYINMEAVDSSESYSGSIYNGVPIMLFANSHSGTVKQISSTRLYGCKIYDNDILVRDYIPALRQDGVAGLYDSINDTFYSSDGNSNFIVGDYKQSQVIATQTTLISTYKIPFGTPYIVKAEKIDGYITPTNIIRIAETQSCLINMQYMIQKVIDLSLQDIFGNAIPRSTANCYVVREPGRYKFPCVYGNAIKNGVLNPAAFTNNGGEYSHNFVDGKGNIIKRHNISFYYWGEYNVMLSNVDADNVFSEVKFNLSDHSAEFTINSIPSGGCNGIISAYYDTTVIWSWHIWVWPYDLTPVEISNSTGVKYKILPTNLASKYDSDGVHIKNWFYQWGRPNPMLLPSAWNSKNDHTPGSISKISKLSGLKDGLANPTMFPYNSSSSPYNWFGDVSYYNLWDAACTSTGNSDNDTVKTVYDPCPVGWKVPNGNTFTGFSIINTSNGIVKFTRYSGDSTGVGFPMSGNRHFARGSLGDVGSRCYAWLSSSGSQDYAHYLRFYSDSVDPQRTGYRAMGFSIRPVEDNIVDIDSFTFSFKFDESKSNNGINSFQVEVGTTWFEWVDEYIYGVYRITEDTSPGYYRLYRSTNPSYGIVFEEGDIITCGSYKFSILEPF